jgi:hypothetical protein
MRLNLFWRSTVVATLGVVSAVLIGGCSFIYDDSANQCSKDADCTARGFVGTVCDTTQHVCTKSLAYCSTNAQCVAGNGNQPYMCRQTDHTCVSLLSPECTHIYGQEDVGNDNTIFLGSVWAYSTNPGNVGAANSMELARQDWKALVGGIPGTGPGKPVRPIVFIGCDVNTPDQATPATQHLVNDIGTPVIIGYTLSTVIPATQVAFPKDVAILHNPATNDSITNIPNRKGLLFRQGPTDQDSILTYNAFIPQEIQPRIQAKLGANTPLRLVVAKKNDQYGISLASLMDSTLKFNGKSVADNATDGNYAEISYGNPGVDPDADTKVAAAVEQILQFKPHIILFSALDDPAQVYKSVEAAWTEPSYRPYYLHQAAAVNQPPLAFWGKQNDDLRQRIFGTSMAPLRSDPPYAAYALRYSSAFPAPDSLSTALGSSAYDWSYFTFFAIASLGDKPLTGRNVGQAFYKFVGSGQQLLDNADKINDGLALISSGQSFDFQGITNTYDLDANGDSFSDIVMYCVNANFGTAPGPPFRDSGLIFRAKTKTLEGKNTCFN